MKELQFINGSLLFAILLGGQIIGKKHDGYDWHVMVKNHEAKENEPSFTMHSTNNYKHRNPDFGLPTKTNIEKDRAKVMRAFEEECEQLTKFKEEFPRPENLPQE